METTTVKITRNTTIKQLQEFINANFKLIQKADKSLTESIAYTAQQYHKDKKSVKKADFVDMAQQIIAKLGDSVIDTITPKKPVVENSTKPKLQTKGDKDNKPKLETKKKKPVEEEVIVSDNFPETLEYDMSDEIVHLTRVHGVETMDELIDLINNNEVFFAFYWSKAQLKKFNYGNNLLPAPKKGFPDNLDLTSLLYVSENSKRVCYSLSVLTEALYQTMSDCLEEIDGVRYNLGIEFQIYIKQIETTQK